MKTKNRVLLEYVRELVGTISVRELSENEVLIQRARSVMSKLERLAV